ncbi:MAG: DEAD/DEAH box helicase [Candidatus Bathyarchaeota archaeon]
MVDYFTHPLIKKNCVESRQYQQNIVKTCLKGNTLVVLPTGLGKTLIAAILTAERLLRFSWGRCFILAPTKPLILQHYQVFKDVLNLETKYFTMFTGETSPSRRVLGEAKVVFMTPQILENDIITGRIKLEDVVLLVFDEAHRAVGNYPYVFIADIYMKTSKNPLILGLTASPGSSIERVEEVKRNLKISFIEARTETSPDVKPYVKPIKVEWVEVKLDETLEKIKINLESYIKDKIKTFHKENLLEKTRYKLTFKKFCEIRDKFRKQISEQPKPPENLKHLLLDLMCVRYASQALNLLETQGLTALKNFLLRVEEKSRRSGFSSAKEFILDGRIQDILNLSVIYEDVGLEHPKLAKLKDVILREISTGARRIIVFTNYRETAKKLVETFNDVECVKAVRLVGQLNKPYDSGLTQKEQAEILSSFKDGKYNVLIATQIGEEGIDISSSDVVVFYDNVPSAVRFIQRRGRTGRSAPGKVVILVTKGTMDAVYYYLAKRREKVMRDIVGRIQVKSFQDLGQQNIEKFVLEEKSMRYGAEANKNLLIIVDSRERNSSVIKELIKFGVNVKVENLTIGDYVLSDKVAVERKTAQDFASSIIDKRLFFQAKSLISTYKKPLIVIEGEDLYTASNINANAIRGAILSLLMDYGIPIILTKNPSETAFFLLLIAEKEQVERASYPSIRGERKPLSLAEQQEYVVASLPNVELTLARRLLKRFGSVEGVFNASKDELKNVPGIGDVIAEKIRKVITEKYTG